MTSEAYKDGPPLDLDEAEPLDIIAYWRSVLDKPLFVYCIQGQSGGPVKIGQAHDPVRRLQSLQCGNPDNLILQAVILADAGAERSIHLQWASCAGTRGEWFGRGFEETLTLIIGEVSARQIEMHREKLPIHHIARLGGGMVARPQQERAA